MRRSPLRVAGLMLKVFSKLLSLICFWMISQQWASRPLTSWRTAPSLPTDKDDFEAFGCEG